MSWLESYSQLTESQGGTAVCYPLPQCSASLSVLRPLTGFPCGLGPWALFPSVADMNPVLHLRAV